MNTDLSAIVSRIRNRDDSRAIKDLRDALINRANETTVYFVVEGDANIPRTYIDNEGYLYCHVFSSKAVAQLDVDARPKIVRRINIPRGHPYGNQNPGKGMLVYNFQIMTDNDIQALGFSVEYKKQEWRTHAISYAELDAFLRSQAGSEKYKIGISDSEELSDTSCYSEVVIYQSVQQVYYDNGDGYDSYIAHFPQTLSVGNETTPKIGTTVEYITVDDRQKIVGRVMRMSGDLVVVQKWNGIEFESGFSASYEADIYRLEEIVIPLESCIIHPIEKTIRYIGDPKTVYASYVFAGEDFLLYYDIPCNQLIYREIFGKTYICTNDSAHSIWDTHFRKECNIEYGTISFVGCVYYTYPELTRHICYKGFLSNSLQSRILKRFGDITFDPRYARDKAQVALINELS